MVKTVSTMLLPLGATAPDFALPDTAGRIVSLADFAARRLTWWSSCVTIVLT